MTFDLLEFKKVADNHLIGEYSPKIKIIIEYSFIAIQLDIEKESFKGTITLKITYALLENIKTPIYNYIVNELYERCISAVALN